MVPRLLLRGTEAGQMCAHCAALFAVLDECQGERGRPWRGRNKLVRALGWSRETVTEHVRHLEAAGLLAVEKVGQTQAVYRVHNPSRGVAPVDGTPPTPEQGPVDGTPPGVDGTPPTEHPTCGRDTAHRPRSLRSGSGLTPDLEHSRGGVAVGTQTCARAGCEDPAVEGSAWCAGCLEF